MRPRPETHDPKGGTRDLRHRTLKLGPRPETRDWDLIHGWDLEHKTQDPKEELETRDPGPFLYMGLETRDTRQLKWDLRP